MQISSNTTAMHADLSVQVDKHGRDHCVVVIKGTYVTESSGALRLSAQQRPVIQTDEYYGEPDVSALAYESDFALHKPATDVIVVGKAVTPDREAVTELPVALEVDGRVKHLLVIGERRWVRTGFPSRLIPTPPIPFVEMPLRFDRGLGDPEEGAALPNIEDPRNRVTSSRNRPAPVGFGCVGRNWPPRLAFAGTYDEQWRDTCCPFLPADFDDRYFQCAPTDQQFPYFRGGELIRCVHMSEQPVVQYRVPEQRVPVRFRFVQGEVERIARLDTIILEPHRHEVALVWRASVPLRKKLADLRDIEVGDQPTHSHDRVIGRRRGKPVFPGIAATIRWLEKTERPF
jgi:hypothetical protein